MPEGRKSPFARRRRVSAKANTWSSCAFTRDQRETQYSQLESPELVEAARSVLEATAVRW
jgi:hypothetical protein